MQRAQARWSEKGSILLLVLWSLCLLGTFALILSYGVRQRLALVGRLDERDQLHFIAEAGVKKAIAQLKNEESKTYDALKDGWSNNPGAFKDIELGEGRFSVTYNYLNEQSGFLETGYGLVDEESKLNLNKAGLAALERIFKIAAGLNEVEAQELAASIVDWRDEDSALSIPWGSAEDSDYRDLAYPYEAKDADFEVLEELLLVKGMTKESFEKLRPYVTIYGNGKVNVNTASRVVLLALGFSDDLAEKILSFRSGEDKVCGNADDNVFESASELASKLAGPYRLNDSEIAQLNAISGQDLNTNSRNFMVRSVASLNNRKITSEVVAVVSREEGKVLSWQES